MTSATKILERAKATIIRMGSYLAAHPDRIPQFWENPIEQMVCSFEGIRQIRQQITESNADRFATLFRVLAERTQAVVTLLDDAERREQDTPPNPPTFPLQS